MGPILFLIYINDLPDGVRSICKIFAGDISLFSKVNKNCSAVEFNNDLNVISNWIIQWKMLFNCDPNKQALGTLFSIRCEKDGSHPSIYFIEK